MLRKKDFLYLLFSFLIIFSACQKDPVVCSNDYKTLGTSAHQLLAASPYKLLQVEINYMPGYAPGDTVVNNLLTFLNTYINKPAGIQVMLHQIAAT